MDKTVSAFEARRQFGQILQDVLANHVHYIVERHGQPVAAIVPVAVLDQWRRGRDLAFAEVAEFARRVNMDPDEAERLALELVEEARRGAPVG